MPQVCFLQIFPSSRVDASYNGWLKSSLACNRYTVRVWCLALYFNYFFFHDVDYPLPSFMPLCISSYYFHCPILLPILRSANRLVGLIFLGYSGNVMLTVQTPSSSKRSKRFLTNSYDVRAFASQFPSPTKCGYCFPKVLCCRGGISSIVYARKTLSILRI